MPGTSIRLDNPAFAGRLRTSYSRRSTYERRAVMSDVRRTASRKPVAPTAAQSTPSGKMSVARSKPKTLVRRQERSNVLMRQLVRTQKSRSHRRHRNVRGLALTSLAAVLFVFGIGVGVAQLNTNKEVKAQVKTLAAQTDAASTDGSLPDGNLPSEDPNVGGGYWRPAGDEPKRIKIPSLSVNARILKMGVMPSGEIKTPANIFDAGWLETTAKPGEHGAMFIDGHVHGPTKPGVFAGVKKLQPGDKITVERGDGTVFTYSVVKTETYDKDSVDMVAALNTAVPGKPGLNLMTCDGRYNAQNGYDKRVVVFAALD